MYNNVKSTYTDNLIVINSVILQKYKRMKFVIWYEKDKIILHDGRPSAGCFISVSTNSETQGYHHGGKSIH